MSYLYRFAPLFGVVIEHKMKKRTKGAWLIHHTKKLQDWDAHDFEDIELAGKCGIFLSNLAASDEQSDLSGDKVAAIAKISKIKKTEIETIKKRLSEAHLIDLGNNNSISVLGITTSTVLSHAADIFNSGVPNKYEEAALDLAENISDLPKGESILKDYISDTYLLSKAKTNDLFNQSEELGFVDFEKIDESKFYFNGNLFRKESINKTNAVLSSLKSDDINKINSLDQILVENGCTSLDKAKSILGDQLLAKLQSIGMYDFNEVSNSSETQTFVTKPSAFSKYGDPFEEDALDLAKAFVSSLYYGMNYSATSRGKITYLKALMRKLVNGYEVGPATAIGEDYKLLELKRVIKIRHEGGASSRYFMSLLKKDIGELALQVLEFGDTTDQLIKSTIMSGAVTDYKGPEQKRYTARKKQSAQTKNTIADILRTLRN